MSTVNLIGTGNVAWHLTQALHKAPGIELQQLAARYPILHKEYLDFYKEVVAIQDLQPADLTIIAISDTAITRVSEQIPFKNKLVVHTSGSIKMGALSPKNRNGVFYPLQTFSKATNVNFSEIPICLEWENDKDETILAEVAFALSENVKFITSSERKQLHLAAVFANNFTNHCLTVAEDICHQKQLDFDLLRPLIEMTVEKALKNSPKYSQTGPAMRNDKTVMDDHITLLSDEEHKEIYKAISNSITNTYGKKL